MDKREAMEIILRRLSERIALKWDDWKNVTAGLSDALDEIDFRRQEAGPEVMETRRRNR